MGRVDIEEALLDAGPIIEAFWHVARNEGAPAWSGGVLDSWPAVLAEGLPVCREETQAVRDYMSWCKKQKNPEVAHG